MITQSMHAREALTRFGFSVRRPAGEQLDRRRRGTQGSEGARAARPATSAQGESSVVLYGESEGRGVLLTSDAGIRALSDACTFAGHPGLGLPSNLRLMQLPNDGKPDHLSSRVLDRLVGERQPREQRRYTKTAFMTAPPDAPPMGHRIVTDALMRRGALSFMSQGKQLHHAHEMPERSWYVAKPVGTGP